MNTKNQMLCLYAGYLFFPVYLIGFGLFSGFIPIVPPSWNGLELTAFFLENRIGILIGQLFCCVGAAFLVPWAVAIFGQMIRIESGFQAISYSQLGFGIIGAVFFMVPSFVWAAMAYRTTHEPATMLLLNDFAWIAWVISWPPFAFQAVAIFAVVVMGKSDQQVFPRWAAYTSLWLGIAMVPASLAVFFYKGPFAWNGLIAVYLPLVIYTIWWHVIFISVRRAIKSQAEEATSSEAAYV